MTNRRDWTFGQIVAVAIWAEPLLGWGHDEVKLWLAKFGIGEYDGSGSIERTWLIDHRQPSQVKACWQRKDFRDNTRSRIELLQTFA